MSVKSVLLNMFLAFLTLVTGIVGQMITRIVKFNFVGKWWMYIPIFWIPGLSAIPAIYILFGGLDT